MWRQNGSLFEPIGKRERLIIFGAGHVGRVLSALAPDYGFWTIVVDPREEFAKAEHLPHAHEIVNLPYGQALQKLHFDENTYVVVVTNAHTYDELVLKHCAPLPLAYLGAIGSATKTKKILNDLVKEGLPAPTLEHIHMPIGLNIGAQTPPEIGISIMAELIATKYGVDVRSVAMSTR